jgi:predicted AAA+ superfamily ATPase
MDWQYDVIRRMGRKTIVFGPRRAGKTFLLAFLARREIMAQKMNFQNQYRPVSVLYLGLSDAKNMKVVSYLKGMDKMFSKNAE